MRTSMEILGRLKEAFVPADRGGARQMSLPLAARASLLHDLCDLEDVPAAYAPTVAALWNLVEELEASTNGALAARQMSETLEIACPDCTRPAPRERRALGIHPTARELARRAAS